jgi:hypothetical protein
MRIATLLAVLALLAGAASTARALDGENGSTVTPVFSETSLVSGADYSAGSYFVKWADLSSVFLGPDTWNLETPVIAANASGDVFVRVAGYDASASLYSGLLRWNGSAYRHLVQDRLVQGQSGQVGSRVDCVAVSPATAGSLTAGDPVVSCFVQNADGKVEARLVSIGHASSPVTETTVYTFASARVRSFEIGSGGAIFAAVTSTSGGTSLVKLTVSGTGYAATTLRGAIGPYGVVIGADGAIHAFDSDAAWGQGRGENDILRIDASTGATSVYATVSSKVFFGGWCLDGAGVLRIGIGDPKKLGGYVTTVKSGETVSLDDSIASTPHYSYLRGFCDAGSDGSAYVLEWPGTADSTPVTAYRVTPGTGGGKPPKKPKK